MIENRISGYLYNGLFSESNDENNTAFQSMAWFFIVHKDGVHLTLPPHIFSL